MKTVRIKMKLLKKSAQIKKRLLKSKIYPVVFKLNRKIKSNNPFAK